MKMVLGSLLAIVLMGGFLGTLVVAANNHQKLSEPVQINLK